MLYMFDKGFISLTNRYLTWKICNFHTLPIIVGSEIRSPQFVYAGSRYTLVIWPRGQKGRDPEEWFGICLYKNDGPISKDTVQFSIVNGFGKIKTCIVECSENNIFRQERFMEWSEFRALGSKITPNGCLTIVCRLPMEEESVERRTQNGNKTGILNHPLNDPPVKYQSGDYHSPNPELMRSSLKSEDSKMRATPFGIPAFNCGSPSTVNSFFSASSLENSFEYVSDSADMQNSDFDISYNEAPENTWYNFTRRFLRSSKRNNPDVAALDPDDGMPENSTSQLTDNSATAHPEIANAAESNCSEATYSHSATASFVLLSGQGDSCSNSSSQTVHSEPDVIPENQTSQLIDDSATSLPEIINSAEKSDCSETAFSHSATTNSVLLSGQGDSCSNFPSQTVHSADKCVEGTESQRRAQIHVNAFQDFIPSSSGNTCSRSNLIGEASAAAVHYPKGLKVLSENFKNLYRNGKDFDLTIIMEGKEFKVLRGILKSRSPVLDKLLSENTSNIISISPFGACDSSVFHDFLLYIYSGEVENMSHKNIYGLYSAACEFELPELKEECVEFLKMAISVDTITDIVRLINNDSELLDIVILFLAKNMEIIMQTDEWKQFLREDPDRAIAYQLKALKIGYTKTIV